MAVAATGRVHLHQAAVVRGVGRVDALPGIVRVRSGDMTGDTIATTSWNPCFQIRNRIMAEQTLIRMDLRDGPVFRSALSVATQTQACGRSAKHIASCHMVDIAMHGQVLVRMTGQAIGWVSPSGDRIDDICSLAVMASGTGTISVGWYVVLYRFDLSPG